jgi:hypothetical protein
LPVDDNIVQSSLGAAEDAKIDVEEAPPVDSDDSIALDFNPECSFKNADK